MNEAGLKEQAKDYFSKLQKELRNCEWIYVKRCNRFFKVKRPLGLSPEILAVDEHQFDFVPDSDWNEVLRYLFGPRE